MNTLAHTQGQLATSSFAPVPMSLVQRKCACGSAAGMSGECDECQKDKLMGDSAPLIQPKLKISQSDNKYEEADEVMRMPEPNVERQITREGEEEDEETSSSSGVPLTSRTNSHLSFEVKDFKPGLRRQLQKPSMETAQIEFFDAAFTLRSRVRARFSGPQKRKEKKIELQRWKLGYIQEIEKDKLTLNLKDLSSNASKTYTRTQKGIGIDCPPNKDFWYVKPKVPFIDVARSFSMKDAPSTFVQIGKGHLALTKSRREFNAKAHLVAKENTGSTLVLKTVKWGFDCTNHVEPLVEQTAKSGIWEGTGFRLISSKCRLIGPHLRTGDNLTATTCTQDVGFDELLGDASEGPKKHSSMSIDSEGTIGSFNLMSIGATTATPRINQGFSDEQTAGDSDEVSRLVQLKNAQLRSLEAKAAPLSNQISQDEQDSVAEQSQQNNQNTKTELKDMIEAYRTKCTGIASVKCRSGEIVEDLPDCMVKAPCGIGRCVKEHELSHARDIAELFQERLGRHPCKKPDGTSFIDGFNGFGEDFVSKTGEDRTWKRFLLGSERKAYGVEVRCLRETRKTSRERLCKRALALEAAKSAFRRFLSAIGINPGV